MFFVDIMYAFLFVAVMAFASGIRDIYVDKEINVHTDSVHRATVISVKNMFQGIIFAIVAPILGYISDILSPAFALLLIGIFLGLLFFFFLAAYLISKKEIL